MLRKNRRPSTCVAVPADFSHSVASADESPTLRNLSQELRLALAEQPFNLGTAQLDRIDFISPSAEPGGARVAFALDLEQARGTTSASPNDVWILDLTKEPNDAAALTMVPKVHTVLRAESLRWVAWDRDQASDRIVFATDDLPGTGGFLEFFDAQTATSEAPRPTDDFLGSFHGGVIAAIPNRVGGTDLSDILLMDLASGTEQFRFELGTLAVEACEGTPPIACPVGSSSVPANEEEPELSPDGAQVAFTSAPAGETSYTGGALYVADLIRSGDVISGGTLRRIGTVERAMSPIWSPDGEWIVYQDETEHDLFAIRAAGGDPIRLTFTGALTAANLTWLSPLALPTSSP